MNTPLLRLAVLASHEATTMQAVIDATATGELPASVTLVISNNSIWRRFPQSLFNSSAINTKLFAQPIDAPELHLLSSNCGGTCETSVG